MRTKNYIQIKKFKNDILPLFDPKDSWSLCVCGHFFFLFLVQALVAVFDSSTRWQQFTCHVEQLPSPLGTCRGSRGKALHAIAATMMKVTPFTMSSRVVETWISICLFGGVFWHFFISSVKYEGESSSQQSSARASWSNLPHKCSPWGKTYASFTLSVLLVPLNRTEQGSLLDPVAPDPIDSHYHQLLNAWRWEYSDWSFYFQSRGSHVMHMSIILCGFSPAGR